MEQLYPSQSQPDCAATLCVARDRVKAQGRRKYIFTDQIDQLIREIYLNHRNAKTRPGIRLLAKKVGMPHWALKKRARELGLARTKELPWSERELGILARYAWMSDERIRLKLKAAGYSRTLTGIHLKLKRMRFKHDDAFHVSGRRWCQLGELLHHSCQGFLRGTRPALKELIKAQERALVITEPERLHAFHVGLDDGPEMAPEARKAAKVLQGRVRVRAHQRTHNGGGGLSPAHAPDLSERVCSQVAAADKPIQKAGDDLRASDSHVQR